MAFVSILSRLSETTSRIEKESILSQAFIDEEFQLFEGLKLAYDPLITFGVAKVALIEEDDDFEGDFTFDDFKALANDLIARRLTGNAARDAIKDAASRASVKEWNLFYRRILLKDMAIGVEAKTINKVLKNFGKEAIDYIIPVFGCQLAQDGVKHEKKIKGKKLLDVKLDGVRLISVLDKESNSVTQFTRNGKVNENFEEIRKSLENMLPYLAQSVVLDGEVVSSSFQELMTQLNRKDNIDTSSTRYALFDFVPLEDFEQGESPMSQSDRHAILSGLEYEGVLQKATGSVVYVVPKLAVDLDTQEGQDAFKRFNREALEAGYEGVMVKDPDAPYVGKRSMAWLKIKPVIEVSLEVVDLQRGEPDGKHAHTLGALVCRGEDDGQYIEVNVGSGLMDEDRNEIWSNRERYIGMIAEIRADAITKSQDGETYSLRFPRFKGWRGTTKGEKL